MAENSNQHKNKKGYREGDENKEDLKSALRAMEKSIRGLGAFHMNACVRCGLCVDTCHIYMSEPDVENMPAVKAARVMSLFRRYHTLLGKHFPWFVGARDVTPEVLDELMEVVYGRCTACGRCSIHCAVGVDVHTVIRAGRLMCAASGRVPEGLRKTVNNQIKTGNQMAIEKTEFLETCEWLSEELALEMKDPEAKIHIDRKGSRMLYLVNPREIKFFPLSLQAAGGVFHAAGENWTISSAVYDVTNYGFYAGDDKAAEELTRRMLEEADRLGVEEVILSECGHGFRSFRWEGPGWIRKKYPFPVRSELELVKEFIEQGRIKVDKAKNRDRVTLHDPCNLVRWGGLAEPQRWILRRVVEDFREMTPNREHNYCCGGGGGMLSMSEYGERRVKSGQIKADQIRGTGAKIVACPCHNCADQLIELSKVYKLGVEILAVIELVYNALLLEK